MLIVIKRHGEERELVAPRVNAAWHPYSMEKGHNLLMVVGKHGRLVVLEERLQ